MDTWSGVLVLNTNHQRSHIVRRFLGEGETFADFCERTKAFALQRFRHLHAKKVQILLPDGTELSQAADATAPVERLRKQCWWLADGQTFFATDGERFAGRGSFADPTDPLSAGGFAAGEGADAEGHEVVNVKEVPRGAVPHIVGRKGRHIKAIYGGERLAEIFVVQDPKPYRKARGKDFRQVQAWHDKYPKEDLKHLVAENVMSLVEERRAAKGTQWPDKRQAFVVMRGGVGEVLQAGKQVERWVEEFRKRSTQREGFASQKEGGEDSSSEEDDETSSSDEDHTLEEGHTGSTKGATTKDGQGDSEEEEKHDFSKVPTMPRLADEHVYLLQAHRRWQKWARRTVQRLSAHRRFAGKPLRVRYLPRGPRQAVEQGLLDRDELPEDVNWNKPLIFLAGPPRLSDEAVNVFLRVNCFSCWHC